MDKNLEDLTVDELVEKTKSNNMTFGEMNQILNMMGKVELLNRSLNPDVEKLKNKEKRLNEVESVLYKIKELLDELFEDEDDDYDD